MHRTITTRTSMCTRLTGPFYMYMHIHTYIQYTSYHNYKNFGAYQIDMAVLNVYADTYIQRTYIHVHVHVHHTIATRSGTTVLHIYAYA
jgi:hypothetical protein